jgi:hypothetical protein
MAAEVDLTVESVLGTAVIMSGLIAARPAFATAGRLYWATDENILYRDTGAAWVNIGTLDLADMTERLYASLTSRTHGNVDHTVAVAPVDVTKAAAAEGVSAAVARADHKHDITTAAPTGAVDIGDAAAEGVATTTARADHQHAHAAPVAAYPVDTDFNAEADGVATTPARSDHRHNIPAPAAPANVTKEVAAAGTATSPARADHKHDITTAVPADVTNAAASEGVATSLARSDHKHDITTATPTGAVDIGDAAAEGIATTVALSDHQHAHAAPAGGYPVDTDFSAEADGAATTPARSDHRHNIPAPAAPANVTKDTAAAGTASSPARADHKHDITTGAPTGIVEIGDAGVEGTSTSLARLDHIHPVTAPGAGYPQDVTGTEADGTAVTAARSDHAHAYGLASITGAFAAVVADNGVVNGVQVVHTVDVPDGVTADIDVTITYKFRVLHVHLIKKVAAGGASDTITVKNTATAITNAMDINVADLTVVRVTTIDDAAYDIAAGGILRVTRTKVSANNVACQVVVSGVRVT